MATMATLSLAAILGASFATPAFSRPIVYLSSFTYGGKTEECLKNAKAALTKEGFTRELEIAYYKQKETGGWVNGLLADAPVRAVVECNGNEGITAVAVSGLSDDITFSKYSALFDAKW